MNYIHKEKKKNTPLRNPNLPWFITIVLEYDYDKNQKMTHLYICCIIKSNYSCSYHDLDGTQG